MAPAITTPVHVLDRFCLILDMTQTLSCCCNKLPLISSVATDLYATRFTIGWRLAS